MKKALISLVIVATLIVLNVTGALGETVSVDLLSGDVKSDGENSADASLVILNAEQLWKDTGFKFGADFIIGTFDYNGKYKGESSDYTCYDLKAGYRFYKKNKVNLDLTAAFYIGTIEDDYNGVKWKLETDGVLVGADLVYNASPKIFWEASVAVSSLASVDESREYESYSGDDVSIYNYRLKFNYLITRNTALSLGYRSYTHKYTDDVDDLKREIAGFTLGATVHF